MPRVICFEFSSEEERNEFLLLNDLRVASARPPGCEVVDLYGNRVGQLAVGEDRSCRVDILGEYRSAVRAASWWRAS